MDTSNENPYGPPNAELYDPPATKKPAPVKAILIGIAVDQIGTMLCNVIIGVLFAAQLASRGYKQEEFKKAAASIEWYSWVGITSLIAGGFFSILGGYVCARIARERIFRSAMAMASIEIALSFILSHKNLDLRLLGFIALTFACVIIGAWLHKTIEQKSNKSGQS